MLPRLLPTFVVLWRLASAWPGGQPPPDELQPQPPPVEQEQTPSPAEVQPLLDVLKGALAPEQPVHRRHSGASAGRPRPLLTEFEQRDFGADYKTDIGFPTVDGAYPWPTTLQKELMKAGASYDGGGKFPVDLYKYYPTYHKCETCAQQPLAQLLKEGQDDSDVTCFVCPVIFCVPSSARVASAARVAAPPPTHTVAFAAGPRTIVASAGWACGPRVALV